MFDRARLSTSMMSGKVGRLATSLALGRTLSTVIAYFIVINYEESRLLVEWFQSGRESPQKTKISKLT
jgi:hypothetical protein